VWRRLLIPRHFCRTTCLPSAHTTYHKHTAAHTLHTLHAAAHAPRGQRGGACLPTAAVRGVPARCARAAAAQSYSVPAQAGENAGSFAKRCLRHWVNAGGGMFRRSTWNDYAAAGAQVTRAALRAAAAAAAALLLPAQTDFSLGFWFCASGCWMFGVAGSAVPSCGLAFAPAFVVPFRLNAAGGSRRCPSFGYATGRPCLCLALPYYTHYQAHTRTRTHPGERQNGAANGPPCTHAAPRRHNLERDGRTLRLQLPGSVWRRSRLCHLDWLAWWLFRHPFHAAARLPALQRRYRCRCARRAAEEFPAAGGKSI